MVGLGLGLGLSILCINWTLVVGGITAPGGGGGLRAPLLYKFCCARKTAVLSADPSLPRPSPPPPPPGPPPPPPSHVKLKITQYS